MRTSESGHWNGVAHQGVEMRMACKIEDYAIIGDCETAALVGFLPIQDARVRSTIEPIQRKAGTIATKRDNRSLRPDIRCKPTWHPDRLAAR
jgi:hypothetical protein